MLAAVHRTTLRIEYGANRAERPTSTYLQVEPGDANASILASVPEKYLKLSGDVLSEQNASEKSATDAALLEELRVNVESDIEDVVNVLRAFARLLVDELNARATEHNAIRSAIVDSQNFAQVQSGVAATTPYPTRTLDQLKTAIRNNVGT